MKLFKYLTNGLCEYGSMIILAESEEDANILFEEKLKKTGEDAKDSCNQIIEIKEIDLSKKQIVIYNDGDR